MPLDPLAGNRNESPAPAPSTGVPPGSPEVCLAPFPAWWPETVEEDDVPSPAASAKEDPPVS